MRELGSLIGSPSGADQDEIAGYRNKLYRADPKGYIQKLFKSVNLEIMLADTGFPHEEFTGYSVDLKKFAGLVPCTVYPIFRMDTTVYEIFSSLPRTLEEAVDMVNKDLDRAVKVDKVVAIKSILAYKTGLAIRKRSMEEAHGAYERYKKDRQRDDEKIIREYLLLLGLRCCRENDLPMQFHTGLGTAPMLDILEANPILMQHILADEEVKETKVVLTHSGYPYCTETGYLCSAYPNVYCDVTQITPYFGIAFRKAISALLEFGPANRIMFGSDGGIIPETYWMGIYQGVKQLGEALDELVSSHWLTSPEAIEFAELILHKNARELYKI
jgi:hypothetical protein